MRWPDTCRLMDRIKAERPELIVDFHASAGTAEHYFLRIYCIRKGRQIIPESLASLHSPRQWDEYKQQPPEPCCQPEKSFHTNALGQEGAPRGNPTRCKPPAAEPITAEQMLDW